MLVYQRVMESREYPMENTWNTICAKFLNGEDLMENKWRMEHRERTWKVNEEWKLTTSRKWCFSWHRAMSFPAKHLGENLGSKIWWGPVSGSKVTYIAEVSKAGRAIPISACSTRVPRDSDPLHLGVPYPLVNMQKTMENHHFSWENPL